MAKQKIRIRLKAYDHRVLDQSAKRIVDTAERTGARVVGPVPLPTKIERFAVRRSTFIDKDSHEHFEIRTHNRLIDVVFRAAEEGRLPGQGATGGNGAAITHIDQGEELFLGMEGLEGFALKQTQHIFVEGFALANGKDSGFGTGMVNHGGHIPGGEYVGVGQGL